MSSDWKESKERSIELSDDDPETFEIYQHWLYCGTIPTRNDVGDSAIDVEYLQLGKAYILGDKLRDGTFKDVIIDAILNRTSSRASDGLCHFPDETFVQSIYDNTPKSSEARNLLVDLYVNHGNEQWLNDAEPEAFPNDFLMDLAVVLFGRKNPHTDTYPAESNACKYHQHGSGPCYKDRFDSELVVAVAKTIHRW